MGSLEYRQFGQIMDMAERFLGVYIRRLELDEQLVAIESQRLELVRLMREERKQRDYQHGT